MTTLPLPIIIKRGDSLPFPYSVDYGLLPVPGTAGNLTYDNGTRWLSDTPANILTDIDYAFVSNNDAATDVTAAELEELSDGTETTLHSHAGGMLSHIIDGAYHTVTGSALDVIGLSGADTLDILTPSADVSAGTSALLRSLLGALTVKTLLSKAAATTDIPLTVQLAAYHSANAFRILKSDATLYGGFDAQGRVFSYGGSGITSNTLISGAGNATMTGVFNVGIGSQALLGITSGNQNFGIGTNSLLNLLSGSNNVAIGHAALSIITVGSSNVGIGSGALYNNTAYSNVAVGYEAGKGPASYSSNGNVFIGVQSGYGMTGGSGYNTFVGSLSGYSLTTGSKNNFFGNYSGYRQTTNSGLLIIDNQIRASTAVELTNSILYGVMAATPASQTLRINAVSKVAVNTTTNNAPLTVLDLEGYVSTASTGFANGGGPAFTMTGETATDGTSQIMAKVATTYTDSTNATFKTKVVVSAADAGGQRDGITIEATGSAAIISAHGNTNVTGMVRQTATWHAFGGFQDQAETLSLDADTWTHVTNAGNDLWTGLEADGLTLTDDEMIVTNAGDYVGNLSITITGGNSKDFLFRIYNVTQAAQMGYHIGASTTVSNYTNITLPLYLECDAGDHLQVQAYCLAGDDPTLRSAVFYINYLHD